MNFRPDIQGMRALAVLLVVLNHARVPGLGGGYVGVDVFFVISGFLITGWLLRATERNGGRVPFGAFYAARARRILPAAALTLVATVVAAKWLLNYVRADTVFHDSIWSAFFAANVHFARVGTDYFAQSQPPSPLQHYWSLAVEEQFYLVWPALIALSLAVVRHRTRLLTIPLILATAASLAYSIVDTRSSAAAAYFSSSARAWELGIGALLAISAALLARIPAVAATVLGWAGVGAIIVAATTYSAATPFPGYAALLPVLGAAALITAGIRGVTPWSPGRVLSLQPLRWTGDISYSLYLWHWPILTLVAEHAGRQLTTGENLMLAALAYALASLTYRFFENPLRHAHRLRRTSWRALALWPATVGAVVGAALVAAATTGPPPAFAAATKQPTGKTIVVATLPSVVAAVTAAEANAQLPNPLSPDPSQLLSDHYGYPAGCGANDGQTKSNICRLGDPTGKVIVMFGDSHIEEWMPPMLAMAQADHFAIVPLIKQGCTPPRWVGAYGKPECLPWYRWAMAKLRTLHPAVTLIGGAMDSAGSAKPVQAALLQAFSKTVTTAQRISTAVVINDPPPQAQQPLDCITSSNANAGKCSHKPTNAQLSIRAKVQAATLRAGATFIDTTGWFCYQNICPMVIGSKIVFLDNSHITQTYALALERPLQSVTKKVMRKRRAR